MALVGLGGRRKGQKKMPAERALNCNTWCYTPLSLRRFYCTCRLSHVAALPSSNFTGEHNHTCSPHQSLNKRNCPLPTSSSTCFRTLGSYVRTRYTSSFDSWAPIRNSRLLDSEPSTMSTFPSCSRIVRADSTPVMPF